MMNIYIPDPPDINGPDEDCPDDDCVEYDQLDNLEYDPGPDCLSEYDEALTIWERNNEY